jgi:hypothetical protein
MAHLALPFLSMQLYYNTIAATIYYVCCMYVEVKFTPPRLRSERQGHCVCFSFGGVLPVTHATFTPPGWFIVGEDNSDLTATAFTW